MWPRMLRLRPGEKGGDIGQMHASVHVTLNRVLLKQGNIKVINISSLKGYCQKRGILFVTNIQSLTGFPRVMLASALKSIFSLVCHSVPQLRDQNQLFKLFFEIPSRPHGTE